MAEEEVAHGMETWMSRTDPSDMYDFLQRHPPTPEQADLLAWEEAIGRNRGEVMALLEYFRGRL